MQFNGTFLVTIAYYDTMENCFNKDIIPEKEAQRLKALQRYNLIGSVPDGYFNRLANIIARTFGVPIAQELNLIR